MFVIQGFFKNTLLFKKKDLKYLGCLIYSNFFFKVLACFDASIKTRSKRGGGYHDHRGERFSFQQDLVKL